MQIGKLDARIDILQRSVTTDEVGAESVTWAVLRTMRASRSDVSGREIFRGGGVAAEYDRLYTVRTPDIQLDATMRLRDPATGLVITDVAAEAGHLFDFARPPAQVQGRGGGVEIMARAVSTGGEGG